MCPIDDDNRIVLKPIPNNQTFYHDFINAGYIDVSVFDSVRSVFSRMFLQKPLTKMESFNLD